MARAVFGAMGSDGVRHMWITDGTGATTSLVAGAVAPTEAVSFGDKVIFAGDGKLWITDGTAGGTRLLAEIVYESSGFVVSGLDPVNLAVFGDRVVFSGVDRIAFGSPARGLFATDGTVAGTVEILRSNPGNTGSTGRGGLSPSDMTVWGDDLVFTGVSPPNRVIFKGDPTLTTFRVNFERVSEIEVIDKRRPYAPQVAACSPDRCFRGPPAFIAQRPLFVPHKTPCPSAKVFAAAT